MVLYLKLKTLKSQSEVREIIISRVNSISILIEKLKEHRLYGAKYLDFLDFSTGVEIIKSKRHLTIEGITELKILVSGMNQRRSKFE